MSKKVIVFDLDDTLISERDYIDSGFNIISKKISEDYNLNDEKIKIKMSEFFNINSVNLFNRILDYFKVEYDLNYIKKLVFLYRNHIPTIELYDDAKEIIEYLSKNGYELGIITDGYKEAQRNKIKVLNIEKYFKHIVITDELGKEFWKPSEIPYKIIKDKFKCEYKDIVYIGDNIKKDFITANKLGIITIQIVRENGIYSNELAKENKYQAKLVIDNLNKIVGANLL